jgi:putative endonuclease
MAGLVSAIHVLRYPLMLGGYVYILASAPNGILYVGVTNDLVRRIYEHRNGLVAGFTKKPFYQVACLLRAL